MKFLIVMLYLIILGYFGYPLFRNKEYRELTVFSVLMLISLYYVLAVMFDWPLLNPALPVVKLSKLITGIFK